MQISNDKLPAEPNRFHQHDWGLSVPRENIIHASRCIAIPMRVSASAGSPERVASKDLKE